jgi:Uma2 family endonuclease
MMPDEAIASAVPDLAVEVLSPSNRAGEIKLKLSEYFKAGVRLAWVIDPRQRTVKVHTSPKDATELSENDVLDGGAVLPGFRLALKDLFARVPAAPARPKRRRKRKKK